MTELVCIDPNPPAELKHGGHYHWLDSRVTSEGEAQVRVLSGAPGTPQVPHQLWWPTDLFEIAPPVVDAVDTKEWVESSAIFAAAIAELEEEVG